jgi:hypothetical protein
VDGGHVSRMPGIPQGLELYSTTIGKQYVAIIFGRVLGGVPPV